VNHTQHIPDMLPIQQQVANFAVSTCVVVEFKKSTEAVLTGIKISSACCVVTVQWSQAVLCCAVLRRPTNAECKQRLNRPINSFECDAMCVASIGYSYRSACDSFLPRPTANHDQQTATRRELWGDASSRRLERQICSGWHHTSSHHFAFSFDSTLMALQVGWNFHRELYSVTPAAFPYAPVPRVAGIKRWRKSDVCLSLTSGLSREQRGLWRPKLAQR